MRDGVCALVLTVGAAVPGQATFFVNYLLMELLLVLPWLDVFLILPHSVRLLRAAFRRGGAACGRAYRRHLAPRLGLLRSRAGAAGTAASSTASSAVAALSVAAEDEEGAAPSIATAAAAAAAAATAAGGEKSGSLGTTLRGISCNREDGMGCWGGSPKHAGIGICCDGTCYLPLFAPARCVRRPPRHMNQPMSSCT